MKYYQCKLQRFQIQHYGVAYNKMNIQQKEQLEKKLDSRLFRILWLRLATLRDNIYNKLQDEIPTNT